MSLLPWLRWDRGAGIPNQALLFDFVGMRGYVFDAIIWPQQFYLLTGVLVLAAIGLFMVTALRGRIWCGFACPQTVWTDLFIWIETWVEGDRNARILLERAPWTAQKLLKVGLKHVGWLLLSVITAVSFMAFFNDAPTMVLSLLDGSASGVLYGFVGSFVASTYLLAGWGREQICIYMCPWARIQGAMLDPETMMVIYDQARGEPRNHARPKDTFDGRGHCVNCQMCSQACPAGIDIRDGVQMECIACGLCIDACNSVMRRFGLPEGLVAWRPLAFMSGDRRAALGKPWYLRPRLWVYSAVLMAVAVGIGIAAHISPLDLNVLHDRSPLVVVLADGSHRNDYTVKLISHQRQPTDVKLEVEGLEGARLVVQNSLDPVVQSGAHLSTTPDGVSSYRVSVILPAGHEVKGTYPIFLRVTEAASGLSARHETYFLSDVVQ